MQSCATNETRKREGDWMKEKVYQAILCLCLSLEKMIERVEGR